MQTQPASQLPVPGATSAVRRLARGAGDADLPRNVTFSPGRISQWAARMAARLAARISGGLHGGGAPHFAMGGPHGGGPHGTPLRLGTWSRHGRRAPRGAPLHGARQRQIRGVGAMVTGLAVAMNAS
jgi:hypothetical protein